MKHKITIKQKTFAKGVVASIAHPKDSKTPPQVYADVYGVKENTAQAGASRLMNNNIVQGEIRVQIEKVFPPKVLQSHLEKLLNARKSAWFEGRRVGSDPDNGVRLETLRTILKVMGAYTAQSTGIDNRSVNFYLAPDQLGALKSIASELSALNAQMLGTD